MGSAPDRSRFDDAALSDCYQPLLRYRHWLIAYSGGLDSTVLLYAARKFLLTQRAQGVAESRLPQLSAIYIDHQLQSQSSDWQSHCERFCRQQGVPFIAERVAVEVQGKGLESAARSARYAAFSGHLQVGGVLLTGHHADDQVETLLLRLLRGSGLRGASAIPASRSLGAATVCRPLLSLQRCQLVDYADREDLPYIEDPSNEELCFERNFVRQRLLPLLEQRWPAARKTLRRFASHAAESAELLTELASIDAEHCGLGCDVYGRHLPLQPLLRLSSARRGNLLRYVLSQSQCESPSAAQMGEIERLLAGQQDGAWFGLSGCRLCLHRQSLYFVPVCSDAAFGSTGSLSWQPRSASLDCGVFSLSAERVPSGGEGLVGGEYRVGARQSGQRYLYRGQHRSLKKLLNESAIPFWLRDSYPIIYCGEEIAAIGDLLVCDGRRVERGWRLSLRYTGAMGSLCDTADDK